MIVDEVDPALWAFGKLAGIDTDNNDQMSNEELHGWLQKMDNPLSLLDNPLIRQFSSASTPDQTNGRQTVVLFPGRCILRDHTCGMHPFALAIHLIKR